MDGVCHSNKLKNNNSVCVRCEEDDNHIFYNNNCDDIVNVHQGCTGNQYLKRTSRLDDGTVVDRSDGRTYLLEPGENGYEYECSSCETFDSS